MDNNVCTVDIDNTTYYIPCDRIRDLFYDGEYLINYSSSTINLRSGFEYNENVYPQISCNSMSICTISTGNNITRQPVRSNYSYDGDLIKIANLDLLIFCVLFIFMGVKLVWKR